MFAYLKYGKYFALYIEFSLKLGTRPLFGVDYCNGETILHMPYGQVILTPGRVLQAENRYDVEEQDSDIRPPSARDAED